MKLTAANAAAFLTMTNAQQHYARAARDYFRDPTPERKEYALRKGALFYGHLRKLRGPMPREGYYVATDDDHCIGWRTSEGAEQHIAETRQRFPLSYKTAKVIRIREVAP